MKAPRRGRPPKPPDEVRRIRVTVLLNDHEDATLSRVCGGRGVATMLREAGLREAAAMKVPGATLAGALLEGATPERLAWLADVGEALTVTSGTRVGKSAAMRKVVEDAPTRLRHRPQKTAAPSSATSIERRSVGHETVIEALPGKT